MDNNIKKIISETVKEILLTEFWGRKEKNVFAELENLDKQGADMRDYVRLLSQFPKMGEGASRIVYAIDDDLVVKLEKPYGDPQNEHEADTSLQSLFGSFVPKVFKNGIDYRWIVSEKVTPVATKEQEREWLKKAGLEDIADRNLEMYDISVFLEEFHSYYDEIEKELGHDALNNVNAEKIFNSVKYDIMRQSDNARNGNWDFDLEDLKRWAENPVIGLISIARKDHNVAIGDIGLGNIGFGADGRPVILDLGFSKSFMEDGEYYT